jgi:hypothetical protein
MFDTSTSGCRPVSFGTLKPGDTIRLKIAPIRSGPVTVRLAVVQWVAGSEVGVQIDLIDPEDERKLDEVTRSSGRRESFLARWQRRLLGWDEFHREFHRVHLSYAPRVWEERASEKYARLSEAA